MKLIGRLVVRDNGENQKAGLMLGMLSKGQTIFNKGDVWEITECLGELTLKLKGKSCVKYDINDSVGVRTCWCNSIETIMNAVGSKMLLTDTEIIELKTKGL